MRRKQEIEVKLEVRDPEEVKRRLRALGFCRIQARHFESNRLFDFPDGALRRARSVMRLRVADGKALLTFKGAPARSRRYKVRRELETEVPNADVVRELLEGIGLEEIFRYDKYRTRYAAPLQRRRIGQGEIVYDETPIGNYLELEGPRRWIDRVARGLGFGPRNYITLSYATLYYLKCRAAKKKPGNMVFESRNPAGRLRSSRTRRRDPGRC
ncbi:MAG TPA: class IV adenylate cyclase [Terriglobia bacterium]|nr:class IV adenylate cyclase [Terriglobia bacterium]